MSLQRWPCPRPGPRPTKWSCKWSRPRPRLRPRTRPRLRPEERTPMIACKFANVIAHRRSLIANLLAGNCYKSDHLKQPEDGASLVEKGTYFYIAGFSPTVSPDSILLAPEHAAANDKVMHLLGDLCLNWFSRSEDLVAVTKRSPILNELLSDVIVE